MNLPKKLSGQTPLGVIFVGFALSLALIFYFGFKNAVKRIPAPLGEQEKTDLSSDEAVSAPARLKIPGINVDAVVESVGLTSGGAMDMPKNPDEVAWFNLGTRPGENGSAVIDGHYGTWKNGQGSVFDNLYKLRPGDKVYIEDDGGATATFVVRESRSYDPNAEAVDVFSSSDGKSHLNLITCEGTWNKNSKSYSQRLVVFTDKEGD